MQQEMGGQPMYDDGQQQQMQEMQEEEGKLTSYTMEHFLAKRDCNSHLCFYS